jgi:hypothetical protein
VAGENKRYMVRARGTDTHMKRGGEGSDPKPDRSTNLEQFGSFYSITNRQQQQQFGAHTHTQKKIFEDQIVVFLSSSNIK